MDTNEHESKGAIGKGMVGKGISWIGGKSDRGSRFALPVAFWAFSALGLQAAPKPNIVLMMVDDMGIGDTNAYLGKSLMPGSPPIGLTQVTPNLEKFAKKAMVFTDVHAGASMCSSSRYSLLTGRFGHRPYLKRQGWLPHGPNRPMIQRALVTLPEMLQANGYHTACIGKYHVGMDFDNGKGQPATDFYHHDVDFTKPLLDGPTHHGFDEFFGVPGNTEDPLDTEPRIYIRNDRWTLTDLSKMVLAGMERHKDKILADPEWDLKEIGPVYASEVEDYLNRASKKCDPFFLYFVPNSNHQQRWEGGRYAVPETVLGQKVAGASKLTNGEWAGERGDMVLENDIIFGRVLELLEALPDPRNGGKPLIENTIVIFTSDNGPNEGQQDAPSYQSGGLRGKKAKITEGGLRIPYLMYWKGRFEKGEVNRTHFALTDLHATFAGIVGHKLGQSEALDSYDALDSNFKFRKSAHTSARLKFCNLGPPFRNDALILRKGAFKLVTEGGVAEPGRIPKGTAGSVEPKRLHNLVKDPVEVDGTLSGQQESLVGKLGEVLLKNHNQGYSRSWWLNAKSLPNELVLDDGWHNLRNDLDGEIGYIFQIFRDSPVTVTHLGMWDNHDNDSPVRDATAPPDDSITEKPTFAGGDRKLSTHHTIRLSTTEGKELASVRIGPGDKSQLSGEFRYLKLQKPLELSPGTTYQLTQSTSPQDGDLFHNPAPYDGLSPRIHPSFGILRSVYLVDGMETPVPTYFKAHPDYWKHRLPVGPTLKFSPAE